MIQNAQNPLLPVVHSVQELVVEVLGDIRGSLERTALTETTTLAELSQLFQSIGGALNNLSQALLTFSSGLNQLAASGASAEQVAAGWQKIRGVGN